MFQSTFLLSRLVGGLSEGNVQLSTWGCPSLPLFLQTDRSQCDHIRRHYRCDSLKIPCLDWDSLLNLLHFWVGTDDGAKFPVLRSLTRMIQSVARGILCFTTLTTGISARWRCQVERLRNSRCTVPRSARSRNGVLDYLAPRNSRVQENTE